MAPVVTIAPVSAQDHAAWLRLWHGYLAFYEANLDAKTSAATFDRLVDPGSPIHGALAKNDAGELIGLVHWLAHPATWTTTSYCYLEDLFVAPDARGGGTGQALIEHVRDWASRNNSSKVYWLTAESNSTARALYDRVSTHTGMVQYQISID